MRHTISVLVENKFGALTRIAGLFSGRGYNIDTLNVAPTQDPNTSHMTIVTRGDDATLVRVSENCRFDEIVRRMDVDHRSGPARKQATELQTGTAAKTQGYGASRCLSIVRVLSISIALSSFSSISTYFPLVSS